METKHKQEYATKLAESRIENGTFTDLKTAIVWGYMKAIEETAAPDLLEALNVAYLNCSNLTLEAKLLIENAINKATK